MSNHSFDHKNDEGTLKRKFRGIWIPAAIWLAPINVQSKILWAELDSLDDDEYGGCYASNKYLCNFMNIKERRLYELFEELKTNNLLITVSFNGRRTVRKAVLPESMKVCADQGCAKVQTSHALKCMAEMHSSAVSPTPPYIDNNKEYNKEREGGTESVVASNPVQPSRSLYLDKIKNNEMKESENHAHSTLQHNIDYQTAQSEQVKNSLSVKKDKEKISLEYINYGSHVRLKSEEYENLCKTIGKNLVDEYISDINDYILSKGVKPYKCYAATIRRWHKKTQGKGPSTSKSTNQNAELAKKIRTKYSKVKGITLGYNYLEFDNGRNVENITFDSKDFMQRVNHELTKRNLEII
jgi:helix-turn-helix protein